MKLLLQLLCFSLAIPYAGAQVTIDTSMTPSQLIGNVLFSNPYFPSSNHIVVTGSDFGDLNGVGAFQADEFLIPFSTGIVLSTGNVANIPGPNTETLSEGGDNWLGDADLEAIMGFTDSKNASSISFDFTAYTNAISYNFFLASEEYGTFECTFGDSFAFIVTDLTTGISENIALIPGTTTPISILSVRGGGNLACLPQNEAYFAHYYYTPQNTQVAHYPPETAPINFNGQTNVIALLKDLVIGHEYNIKMVVADYLDPLYDTAIFIEGGSFGIVPMMAQPPSDIVMNDADNDNVEIFDLRANEAQMLGSIDTSIFSFDFTYYLNPLDAQSGTNPIANPEAYQNTVPLETIYVRMANSYTDVAVTNEFKITINSDLLSTETYGLETLKLYPNPATTAINIDAEHTTISSITIYNTIGQRMYFENFETVKTMSIDVSQYHPGTYFVKLDTAQGTVLKRFLKQ